METGRWQVIELRRLLRLHRYVRLPRGCRSMLAIVMGAWPVLHSPCFRAISK